MLSCWTVQGDSVFLNVKVIPGASKDELLNPQEGRLRIRIAAAPEDGKANAALIAFLAKKLGCSKSSVVINAGEKSRFKTVCLPLSTLKYLEQLVV